jgi:hypothetical protein
MIVSHELAKEAAEELGFPLTVPSDYEEEMAYWNGFCSGRTEPVELVHLDCGMRRAFNAGIEEAVQVNRLRKSKLGWLKFALSRLLTARDLIV